MACRRSSALSTAGWEAIYILGYKVVTLSLLFQAVQCSSETESPLKFLYQNAVAPFDVSPSANNACKNDIKLFHKGLRDLEIWAVKMYDSTAKPPSGLISGNTNMLGDYEECLTIQSPDPVAGQYCLTQVYVEQAKLDSSPKSERLREILDNIHSHSALKSTFEDDSSFFPTFIPLYWGLCVPASCSESDVVKSLSERLPTLNSSADGDLSFRVKIEAGKCQVKQTFKISPGFIFTVTLLVSVGLLAIAGTVYEVKTTERLGSKGLPNSTFGRILLAYSLKRNGKALLRTEPDPGTSVDDITCLHGIRAFFSFMIYTIHRIVFGLFIAYTNRTFLAEMMEGDWTMIFRAFWNNVDTFVVLSGLLTSYFSTKKLQEGKGMNIMKMYLQRYIKFTPIFLVVVLIIGQIVPPTLFGPQMLRVVNHFTENCRNFTAVLKTALYINNFDGMHNMCYPPSHQLVTDMQMYLAAPFFVLAFWKWPKKSSLVFVASIVALASYKYEVILSKKLNSVIFNGISLIDMQIAANLIYLNPIHRLTPYLFGIILGVFLRSSASKFELNKWQLFVGWCGAIYAAYYSFFGANGAARRGYVPDVEKAALFGAIQPILWSCSLSWVIYVCHVGKAETLNRALSWKGFIVFSRLSYAVYMVQIFIIFFRIGSQMAPLHVSYLSLIDMNEFTAVAIFSVLLSLLFLMPIVEIRNLISRDGMKTKERLSTQSSEDKMKPSVNDQHHINGRKCSNMSSEIKESFSVSKENEDSSTRNT